MAPIVPDPSHPAKLERTIVRLPIRATSVGAMVMHLEAGPRYFMTFPRVVSPARRSLHRAAK
jgi:hypothetical protein